MQVSKVINLKNFNKTFLFLKENKILLLLMICFLSGFLLGVFSLTKSLPFKTVWIDYLDEYINLRAGSDFFKITYNSFLKSITYIILLFIAGCSVLGVILLPFIIFTNGLIYGALISLLYAEYALKGIAFNAIVILPPAVIFVSALILAACQSVNFSVKIARLTLPRSHPANLSYDFKNFCAKYLSFSLVTLFSALLDAFISRNFSAGFKL